MTTSETIRATPGLRASDILFTAGGSIRISAPPQHVFNVITNLDDYHLWNSTTPSMTLPKSLSTAAATLQKGSIITMKTIMADQNNKEYEIPIEILQLDRPDEEKGNYVLAWRGKLMPTWFATSERVQEIHPVDNDNNACEIHNFESMSGWGAYVFKYVMGIPEQMKKFNATYLEDLKRHAEATFAGQ